MSCESTAPCYHGLSKKRGRNAQRRTLVGAWRERGPGRRHSRWVTPRCFRYNGNRMWRYNVESQVPGRKGGRYAGDSLITTLKNSEGGNSAKIEQLFWTRSLVLAIFWVDCGDSSLLIFLKISICGKVKELFWHIELLFYWATVGNLSVRPVSFRLLNERQLITYPADEQN